MKNLILISIAILFFSASADAQWYRFKANNEFKTLVVSNDIDRHKEFLVNFEKSDHIPVVETRLYSLEIKQDFENTLKFDNLMYHRMFYRNYINSDTSNYFSDLLNLTPHQMLKISENRIAEEEEWSNVQEKYSYLDADRYKNYIDNYPNSPYLSQANDSIAVIEERIFWYDIKNSFELKNYEKYISDYPNGKYLDDAQIYVELCEEWNEVKTANTYKAYFDYRTKYRLSFSNIFVDSAYQKIKEIEQPDWDRAKKRNSYYSYSNFQKKYPNGCYFEYAEYEIWSLGLSFGYYFDTDPLSLQYDDRNKHKTIIKYKNSGRLDIKMTFENSYHTYHQIIPANKELPFTVPNGYYKVTIKPNDPSHDYEYLYGNGWLVGYDLSFSYSYK